MSCNHPESETESYYRRIVGDVVYLERTCSCGADVLDGTEPYGDEERDHNARSAALREAMPTATAADILRIVRRMIGAVQS